MKTFVVCVVLTSAMALGTVAYAADECLEYWKRNCTGTAECEQKRKDALACEDRKRERRRKEIDAKRDREQRQELEAIKKIEEANKAVKGGLRPGSTPPSGFTPGSGPLR